MKYTREYLDGLVEKHNALYDKITSYLDHGKEVPASIGKEYYDNSILAERVVEELKKDGICISLGLVL